MIDLSQVAHHHAIQEISELMAARAKNQDLPFFRVIAAHYFGRMAATMRARTISKAEGEVVINNYALALGPSGCGKGQAIKLIQKELMSGFTNRFVHETLPAVSEDNMFKIAMNRAARKGTQDADELAGLQKQYAKHGAYMSVFDSGSAAAIKDFRLKLLLASAGSINLQIDEIGSNLSGAGEAANVFLELFDQGYTNLKIIKNASDNARYEEIDGQTPANLLFFGEPTRLFDGGESEKIFRSIIATGYARRFTYAWGEPQKSVEDMTLAERYAAMVNPKHDAAVDKWTNHFTLLADISKHNWIVEMSKDIDMLQLEYLAHCEARREQMSKFDTDRRVEMENRPFRAMKLAGSLAFIDEFTNMTEDHMKQAIKLIEESGEAFEKVMRQPDPSERLAEYLGEVGKEMTHHQLMTELPFYPKTGKAQSDMLTLATAYGYKNHIIIKKRFEGPVELLVGESLKKTDLDEITFSYSDDFATGYSPEVQPFSALHTLTQADGYHWCNHHLIDGHRKESNAIPGFNLICLDVDSGDVTADQAIELMKDHTFLIHTTKRHTEDHHRFRMIFPLHYRLNLDDQDYRAFMDNLAQWLPFATDTGTHQRSRKWLTNANGAYHYNMTSKLLDPLPFIPRTQRNEEFAKTQKELGSLDKLERWFAGEISNGNRNNHMLRYATMLVDGGMDYNQVESAVLRFNSQLSDRLPEEELRRTVLVTVANRLKNVA